MHAAVAHNWTNNSIQKQHHCAVDFVWCKNCYLIHPLVVTRLQYHRSYNKYHIIRWRLSIYSLFFIFHIFLHTHRFYLLFLRCLSLLHFLFTLLKCYMALYAPNVHRFAFGINLKGGKRTIYSYMCFWGMQKVNWSISIAVSAHFVWLNQNDYLLKLQSLLAQFSFNMEFLSHFYLPHGQ